MPDFVVDDALTEAEYTGLIAAARDTIRHLRDEVPLEDARPGGRVDPGGGFQVRNCLAHHPAFLDLIAHERILPLVVDCIGPNLQIRTSHLDYRPPYPADLAAEMGATPFGDDGTENGADGEAGYRNVGFHPDLASPGLFLAPSLDGILPLLEIKVFIPLMDMTESGCGNLWLVPVSARPTSPPTLPRQGS